MDMTKGSIPKWIAKLAIPASIGFFFNTMYNVVDTKFGGLIGVDALAALSLSFPVFFVIIALGSGMATGSTALISNALGKKNKKDAMMYVIQSLTFTVLLGAALTLIGWIVTPYLFTLLGAEGSYLRLSISYMNIILLGSILFMLTFILNGILTSQGDTKTFRNFLIAGFFLNLLLNPFFMFTLGLGFAGIAWATFVIQVIGALYMGYKVYRTELFCRKCLTMIMPRSRYYLDLVKQGLPAGLNMMTVAVGIFIITYFLSSFGKEPVAAYGIATRIEQIALMPTIGLNFAVLAIVGQNNGAGKFERIRQTVSKALKYGIIILTIGYLLVFIFPKFLMGLFTDAQDVILIGAVYLRIAAIVSWAYIILNVYISGLQGIKRPFFALWMGLYRQIAAPIIIFPVLTAFFGLGGIWWGIFATVWSGALITLWYGRRILYTKDLNASS